ncbi:MAG: sodium-dependent transporter [Sphaerochaetaceae bacterium]|nr:sodium-dependent transporter [Sphaerochaetaceae bacterium]
MSNLKGNELKSSTRGKFSGKMGYVLSVAGSAVGLGNIWRFPYLAAKYGGGTFLLVYLILMITFGYALIISETTLGRMTRKSPVGAFQSFGNNKSLKIGGWINAIIPIIIAPYYCVIGGWVLKYLVEYVKGNTVGVAHETYFTHFIGNGASVEFYFIIFALITTMIVLFGVKRGVERVSKITMPLLLILAVIVTVYSVTREGAMEGVKYFLIPDFSKLSLMTVVAAMGQLFYSLSIAMGILYTYGSYLEKDVDIEASTAQIEIFDTGVAILAGLMIIPAVFAFSSGQPTTLNAGPSLMFITIPKVFASMGLGGPVGFVFFLLVFVAAITSSISLAETSASTCEDQFGWSRKKSTIVVTIIIIILGSLSALGFSTLDFITIIGMNFLDFFDFITNSVLMPIAALATLYLILKFVGLDRIGKEVEISSKFKRKGLYNFFIKYLDAVCLIIILISSVANVFGIIKL